MSYGKSNYFAQATLILEAIIIFLLGILIGVLMPDSISTQARGIISQSLIFVDAREVIYAAIALAGFFIVHQFMGWVWLVKESRHHFIETNRWGKIIYLYVCTCLILFSAGILCWQIIFQS
jgi:hypothetical protein